MGESHIEEVWDVFILHNLHPLKLTARPWKIVVEKLLSSWETLCSGDMLDFMEGTWRIIPASKWLVTPFISHLRHLEGIQQPYLGDLPTMVLN